MSALRVAFRRKTPRLVAYVIIATVVLFVAFPQTAPSQISPYLPSFSSVKPPKEVLTYYSDGIAGNWTVGCNPHPIEELIKKGQHKWESMLKRQSKSLEEAVKNYKLKYGRNPPKGFDVWYKWAKENNVQVLDDYGRVYEDTKLFWALSPQTFRDRAKARENDASTFVTHIDPKGESWTDGRDPNFRARDLLSLLSPIAHLMPDYVEFTTSVHDLGSSVLGVDQRKFLAEKIEAGEYATEEELKPFENWRRHDALGVTGIANSCEEDSPAWQDALAIHNAGGKPKGPRPVYTPLDADHPSFVWDPVKTYDYCYYTENLKFHGGLSLDAPKSSLLRPLFHQSKLLNNGEIVLTPLDFYTNHTVANGQNQYLPWEEKTINKLHWRGHTTGDSFRFRDDYNWRNSHRVRLHTITHAKEGERKIYVKSRRTGQWEMQTWEAGKINEAYTDVGLANKPVQCNKEDGTCDEMFEQIDWSPGVGPLEAAKYKYVIDVDGNGWSSRFHRLLASGSVNIKSTIYPEFFTEWLVPWYHYVPIQPNYSELYLILSFFIGVPGSPSTGNDELAQMIAENGRKFAVENWRWEDMQSYMFRLLLEYIRLGKDDRDAWSFTI